MFSLDTRVSHWELPSQFGFDIFFNMLLHLSSGWCEPVDLDISDSCFLVLADNAHGVWPGQGDHSLQNWPERTRSVTLLSFSWIFMPTGPLVLSHLTPLVLKDIRSFLPRRDGGDGQTCPILVEDPGLSVGVCLVQVCHWGVDSPDSKVLVHPS